MTAIRLGGVILALMGAALAALGAMLGLTMLGRPVPALPGLGQVRAVMAEIARASPLPPGSGWQALAGPMSGQLALIGMAAGAVLLLAGLWQVLTGRRSGAVLTVVLAVICGFAVWSVVAG